MADPSRFRARKPRLIRALAALVPVLLWSAALAPPSAMAQMAESGDYCGLGDAERRLAELLVAGSRRPTDLRCNPLLSDFAEERARDMAERGYFSHMTPEREGPNQLLRDLGYPLPPAYRGGLANNVESIAGGIRSASEVWRLLTASATHRQHLLGDSPGFRDQDEYGIAYHRDIFAPHVDYWVVVIARRSRPGEPRLLCTPSPSDCFALATPASPP